MRLLLIGGTGQVGRELLRTLAPLGAVITPPRDRVDLVLPDSIRTIVRETAPDVIVNAGAFSQMDEAQAQPDLAMKVNGAACGVIGEEARRARALLLHFSSAYVFDGESDRPYVETDPPNPVNAYGRSKLAGEEAIAASGCRHIILRLSWIHSLHGRNFLTAILRLAPERRELPVVDDQIGSPTWARTVAMVAPQILKSHRSDAGPTGIFHLSASGAVSRSGFAEKIIATAARGGARSAWASVRPVPSSDYPLPARRPRYCLLDNTRARSAFGIEMPDWENEVCDCLAAA